MSEIETGSPDAIAAMHAALAEAAERAVAVAKSSRNDHHRYKYASSEHVIVEANHALRGSGLAVVPTGSDIVQVGTLYVLQRRFELTHSGGGSKVCSMSWPLEINKGKTPDKAAAGAETTSFAYFLRTLLRMPRLDEDDINHDSHNVPERPQPAASSLGAGLAGPSDATRALLKRIAATDNVDTLNVGRDWWQENRTHFTAQDNAQIAEAFGAREDELMAPAAGDGELFGG